MIELYDAGRLQPRQSQAWPWAAAAVLLTAVGLGAYGWSLHTRLAEAEQLRDEWQLRLKAAQTQSAPSAAVLSDLQLQVQRLEAEGQADPQRNVAPGPLPSQWLQRLGELGSADISLSRVELERGGAVRLEGLAATPQSVSRLLQQWDRNQPPASPMPARAIDVRQDLATAPLLTFKLSARAPAPSTTPSQAPSPTATAKART